MLLNVQRRLTKIVLIIATMATSAGWAWGQTMKTRDTFVIYSSDAELPMYERDVRWEAFYQKGRLAEPFLSDQDIETYDWDNQALILTAEASRRITGRLKSFIVVLGNQRLYGGKGLDRISQMAVRHPVIYSEHLEKRKVFLIRASHDFGNKPNLQDPDWEMIASQKVMDHFKKLNKLRQPWSETVFLDLQKSVQRIGALKAVTTAAGVEASYTLTGTRLGDYMIREDVCWQKERTSKMLGPVFQTVISVSTPQTQRHILFPSEVLLRTYGNPQSEQPETKNNRPVWCITVKISPILTPTEMAGLNLVEKINLALLSGYGGELFDLMEHNTHKPWSNISDMKNIELPIDRKKIH